VKLLQHYTELSMIEIYTVITLYCKLISLLLLITWLK